MPAISISNFSGTYFTSAVPDVTVPVSGSAANALITMTVDGVSIYSEILWPVHGLVTLTGFGQPAGTMGTEAAGDKSQGKRTAEERERG